MGNISLLKKMIMPFMMVMLSWVSASATNYYVDAVNGDDSSNGTTESNAWQTLGKVSAVTFQPGDSILFKAGSVWNERVQFKGSGTEGSPIVVHMYGTGNKPIFNGGGGSESLPTVLLLNEEYWEINNLEITNTNGTLDTYQSDLWGIRVNATQGGEFNHIYIRNCYIHAVGSDVSEASSGGKDAGGIYVTVESPKTDPAWFNDLKIENNIIGGNPGGDLVGGIGIATQSTVGALSEGAARKPFLNVAIRENVVGPTGRNNCIIRVSDGAIVEHNLFKDAGRFSKGHSVFNFNTTNLTVQYNEAYGNVGPASDADRGGFDADYNAIDTYYQYNYSHDNNWGFAWMKTGVNENAVFRYNISQNDKLGIYFYGFDNAPGPQKAKAYNNTHYVAANLNARVFVKGRTPNNTDFYNNIFYFEGSGSWGPATPINCTFENNAYFNISPRGTNFVTADPQLVNGGSGGQDINWSDYPNILTGYHLQSTSPCVDAGRYVSENGGQDFWGNPTNNGVPDIGAHEFISGSQTPPDAPSGLGVVPRSFEQIDLNWTDNSSDENGFIIERKTEGSFDIIDIVGPNVTSYIDYDLTGSTTYTYRIAATNNGGNSDYSNEISATTTASPISIVVQASQDTYVRGGANSGDNYGADPSLVIKKGTNADFFRRTFLQFNLSGYAEILEARLFVYGSAEAPIPIAAYTVDDNWDENSMTWDTAPAFDLAIGDLIIGNNDQWYELDVTSAAQGEISGDGIFSMGLRDDAATDKTVTLLSKENTTGEFVAYINILVSSESPIPVSGVSIDNCPALGVLEGDTYDLNEAVNPSSASDKSVNWDSSDPDVATVDANGVITAVAAGSATITVTTTNGSFMDSCMIEVVSDQYFGTMEVPVLQDSHVRGGDNSGNNYGSETTLVIKESSNLSFTRRAFLKFNLENYTSIQGAKLFIYGSAESAMSTHAYTVSKTDWNENTVTWDTAPALIEAIGEVDIAANSNQWYEMDITSAVINEIAEEGTFSIAFRDDSVLVQNVNLFSKENSEGQYSAYLEISGTTDGSILVTGVNLSPDDLTLPEGETSELIANLSPADATNQSLSWSSDNPEVATVDTNGLVTGVAVGNAVISVSTDDGGYTANCQVNVTAPSEVLGIEFAKKPTLKFYPNPISSDILLKIDSPEAGQLLIMDISGRLVRSVNVVAGKDQISLSDLSSGCYLLGGAFENKMLIVK